MLSHSAPLSGLPDADPASTAHSEKLQRLIREHIHHSNAQQLCFAEFMKLALYAPGLGYYTAGNQKFGPAGDFITAPELSPLFAHCLARQCMEIFAELTHPCILEFGAGSGKLAADILAYLQACDALPERYFILEISPELTARQQQTIKQQCPELLTRVEWLQRLPVQPLTGVIIANEVLDAMPVHRFTLCNSQLNQGFVKYDDHGFDSNMAHKTGFYWHFAPCRHGSLFDAVRRIFPDLRRHTESMALPELPDEGNTHPRYSDNHASAAYTSEVNLLHQPWINSLSQCLHQGLVLLIDYGYPQVEYYHPHRHHGTLSCHFRHHSHDNPLILTGIQDITAHVNFSAVANYAHLAGFDIAGYTTQSGFLLNCGIAQCLDNALSTVQQASSNEQIKRLILPQEMGELFKVLALSRRMGDQCLLGFHHMERRHQL